MITESVKLGDWDFELKRYTLKDSLEIQAIVGKAIREDGTVDEKGVDYGAFYVESLMRGISKAKYNGQDIPITKELILGLDTELANALLAKITELNRRNFFQVKK